MQEYLVVNELVSPDGKQRWLPGSKIELEDARAAIHLRKGNVRPLEHTTPPAEPAPDVIVHEPTPEPAEAPTSRKKSRGD
jgi:hypothetical protein